MKKKILTLYLAVIIVLSTLTIIDLQALSFPERFGYGPLLLAKKLAEKPDKYVSSARAHKKLDTTILYIQLAEALFKDAADDFTVKVAQTSAEITSLLENGFEYIWEKDGLLYFRKRK